MIVKGCPCLAEGHYADGHVEKYDCMADCNKKCRDIEDCTFKKVARNLFKVIEHDLCSNCDGSGYDMGCCDESCGFYQAMKSLEVLNVELEKDNER